MFRELIYRLGVRLRNPNLNRYMQFLISTDKLGFSDLREMQSDKLKSLLLAAQQNSPYYRELFAKIGFNPNELKSLEQLAEIPIIDKGTLIRDNEIIKSTAKHKGVRVAETSGTTGQSLKLFRDELWDSHNRAALFRYYEWYGVNPWDCNGYFWGYRINGLKRIRVIVEDFLQNRFRLFSFDKDGIRQFSKKLRKAKYLHGYSSMIYEVARLVNGMDNRNDYNLTMIKGTSETIFESYQDEVIRAFGKRMISEYGAGESGLIAYECPEAGRMHVNMQNVILEEVDGRAIVTNLLSHSFPIIRYDLGDYIHLEPNDFRCECGRQHQILRSVIGRVGKVIHGIDSTYPSLTLYYVFKSLYQDHGLLFNYQAVQEVKGKLLIRIEQPDGGDCEHVIYAAKSYFGDDIELKVLFNQVLHTMDGKKRDFISYIDC